MCMSDCQEPAQKLQVPWWLSGALSGEFRQDLSLLALMGLELSESTKIFWKWVSRFPIHHENLIESQTKRRSLLFWCWFMFLSFRGKVYTKFLHHGSVLVHCGFHQGAVTRDHGPLSILMGELGQGSNLILWWRFILILGLWFDHNQLIYINMIQYEQSIQVTLIVWRMNLQKEWLRMGTQKWNTRVNNGKIIRYVVI